MCVCVCVCVYVCNSILLIKTDLLDDFIFVFIGLLSFDLALPLFLLSLAFGQMCLCGEHTMNHLSKL